MGAFLAGAWRTAARRAASGWLLISGTGVTVLLAATLMAMGPIYADAVTTAAAQRTLLDAPPAEANLDISVRTLPARFGEVDDAVQEVVVGALQSLGGVITRWAEGDTHELPIDPGDGRVAIAALRFREGIAAHATLVAGTWPAGDNGAIGAAIPEAAAQLLDLDVGDQIAVVNRLDRDSTVQVRIEGLFVVDDPDHPFWFGDRLAVDGVEQGTSFTTFGPFIVGLEPVLTQLSSARTTIGWRVAPDHSNVDAARLGSTRATIAGIERSLANRSGDAATFLLETGLTRILADAERALVATRSGVLILTVQLALLAGYALLLTAGLLAEARRRETELMSSRGADEHQIVGMAVIEGVLLAVPAALAAPWVAVLLLRALDAIGPLASIGLTLNPAPTRAAIVLAWLAALGCLFALAIPARSAARSAATAGSGGRRRQARRGLLQRAWIDVALLALAGIGFWQLRTHGAQITATVQGRLGIDPLLVGAPAIGLLAGAMLALRTVPLLAGGAERVAAGSRSTVQALSAWQVARRPLRYTRSALLLIMAMAIGVFAAAHAATWNRSQGDQATFATGADVRLAPDIRPAAIPMIDLSDAHLQIDGVAGSMPVERSVAQVARSGGTARVLSVEAGAAAQVMAFDESAGAGVVAGELTALRPVLATIPLPGEPSRVSVDLAVEADPLPDDLVEVIGAEAAPLRLSLRLVLQDATGLLHRFDLGSVPADAGIVRRDLDLHHPLDADRIARPAYPVSIVEIDVVSLAPSAASRTATLMIAGLHADDRPLSISGTPWEVSSTALQGAVELPSVSLGSATPGVTVRIGTGQGSGPFPLPVSFRLRPGQTELSASIGALVSADFLEVLEAEVGDELTLPGLRLPGALRIVGAVEAIPTVVPGSAVGVLVDLPTVQILELWGENRLRVPNEWWIDLDGDRAAGVADELRQRPYSSLRLLDRAADTTSRQADPIALGVIGALSIGFLAAAVFAVVGFVMSAALSAAERRVEFALLRAIGLSPRQLGGWLTLENGLLVVVSLAFGTGVGVLLAWLILPLITLGREGGAVFPELAVTYPWWNVIVLEIAVVGTLIAIVAALVVALRRIGLGSLLRMGEE